MKQVAWLWKKCSILRLQHWLERTCYVPTSLYRPERCTQMKSIHQRDKQYLVSENRKLISPHHPVWKVKISDCEKNNFFLSRVTTRSHTSSVWIKRLQNKKIALQARPQCLRIKNTRKWNYQRSSRAFLSWKNTQALQNINNISIPAPVRSWKSMAHHTIFHWQLTYISEVEQAVFRLVGLNNYT